MPPKRKTFVKPGALTQEKNSYGANRNIQRKIPRLNELGARPLERALKGPARRQVSPEEEDDDGNMEYRPSRSEEESSSSGEDDLEDEFTNMAGQGRQRHRSAVSHSQRAASQSSVPEHAASQSTDPESAPSQSTVPERVASQSTVPEHATSHSTDSSVASTSRRVRGKVVGSAAEKRMKALGVKLNVPLGEVSGAFEGANASTFAVELGSHIRRIAPYDKPTWIKVDEGTREAVYMAAEQKFDFGDWKTDQAVKMGVQKLAMHIYREFRSELHMKYKKLLGEGHDPRQYPPDPQRADQWIWMIEHKWETPEWKLQSQRNSMSRSQVKTTHCSGSQSFAQRLSIMAAEEAPSSQAELYRQQHWSKKQNKWITPHAEATYQRLELGLSQSEVSDSPVAQQQLIEEVLGKRVARRQGYRSRALASISSRIVVSTEVSSLRRQLSESQRVQEELRKKYEESQKAQEDLRRQCDEAQKGHEDLRRQQDVMQEQAATQASQIQMLLQRVGLGGLGSTGS